MIEYLSFGRPVVAFELREHRNTAGDCAVYVEPNDEILMSTAIRDLLIDEKRREDMTQRGRKRFYDVLAWENSESELIERYRRLLDWQPYKVIESPKSEPVCLSDNT
jgi:glycosyltransferase involved in cell wall biosynthesis